MQTSSERMQDLASHVPESSIVILATPVQTVLETLSQLQPIPEREQTIVTDVGSTKKRIMTEAQKLLPPGVHFIGGHPMAGSEHSGVEAADPLLFSDQVYALCPYPDTPPDALLSLMDLAESLLALPITVDPEEHDRIMAMVSHLPQLISVALMHAAQAGDAEHAMLDKLAGRGFLDMTRCRPPASGSGKGFWKRIPRRSTQSRSSTKAWNFCTADRSTAKPRLPGNRPANAAEDGPGKPGPTTKT